MFSRSAAAGVIARPTTGHRRRSTTASIAGRAGGSGSSCSTRWSRRAQSRRAPPSTALTSRRNARRSEQRGACRTGDRPLARRLDDQDPRAHRRHRPSLCPDADTRQCQRHEGCSHSSRTGPTDAIPARRQRLRCGPITPPGSRGGRDTRHTGPP